MSRSTRWGEPNDDTSEVAASPDDLLRRADVVAWLRARAVEVRGGLHGALLANERGLDADDIEAGAVAAAPTERPSVLCRRPWYNADAQEDQACLRAAEHDGDCGPPLNLLDLLDIRLTSGTTTFLDVPGVRVECGNCHRSWRFDALAARPCPNPSCVYSDPESPGEWRVIV